MGIKKIKQLFKEHRENRKKDDRNKYNVKNLIVFISLHLLALTVLVVRDNWIDWVICIGLYFVRMFFITCGYHRYFSHRSFKTSRLFQFFLAFMAQTSMQKGVLWWAANHRVHHRHSDHEKDPHSLKWFGFLYSHMGWLFSPNFKQTRFNLIKDFSKFKELVWLNKYHLVPPLTLAAVLFVIGGLYRSPETTLAFFQGGAATLVVGFLISTLILYHGTYSINSLMHLIGSRRYKTTDNSKNNMILALITLGEGWHNNHHHFMTSARQGFFWWEIDITYYILKFLSWFGIVWDLQPVPQHVKYSHKQIH